jgi:hypothetical protein
MISTKVTDLLGQASQLLGQSAQPADGFGRIQ